MDIRIEIETERLSLIPISEKHEEDILREFTPEVTRYMPFTPNGNIDDTRKFIAGSKLGLQKGTDIVLVILDGESQAFLGCCGIHNISKDSIEIGLWIKMGSHRCGYGSEVVSSLIDYIKNNFECDHLLYPVDRDNIASRRIPERLGFSIQKEYTKKKDESTHLNIVEYRKDYHNL